MLFNPQGLDYKKRLSDGRGIRTEAAQVSEEAAAELTDAGVQCAPTLRHEPADPEQSLLLRSLTMHLKRYEPRALIVHGTADTLVPRSSASASGSLQRH